jgi:RNA polymerase sigma factor (sigma-70 family)
MTVIAEFDRLMAEVEAGSEDAVWQLADTYTPHIIRAVRRSLNPKLRQKIDSLDLAQTIWASLLLRPHEFTKLKTPQQLIGYLVHATQYKCCDKVRALNMKKRDIRREQSLDRPVKTLHSRINSNPPIVARDPTPSAIVAVRDQWNYVLSKTSKRDQEILRLRREGHTFDMIGTTLGIDEATARRAMQRLLNLFVS